MEERIVCGGKAEGGHSLAPDPKVETRTYFGSRLGDYKKRLLHTAVFYFGFFTFGWVLGQRGAAFLDLLLITNTGVALGSILFTLAGLASIAGGLVGGFLLDWSGRPLLMMTGVFVLNAALNSTLALCRPLALMSALNFLSHWALSVFDLVVNSHLASLWPAGSSGGFLQGLHFTFSMGAFLSPLATQPFLAPRAHDIHLQHRVADTGEEDAASVLENGTYNASADPVADSQKAHGGVGETQVLYALLITGGLCAVAAVLLVVLMVLPVKKLTHGETAKEERRPVPARGKVYYLALVLLAVYSFLACSVEDVFPHYLMTFVVRHLGWSKASGAQVTSVFWVGLALGRRGGVGLVKLLTPTRILLGCLTSLMTSLLVMLGASLWRLHWAVWIGAGAVGLSTSVLFPTGLMYTHQNVSRLTGKVSALLFVPPMVNAMLVPLVLAYLMTRLHDLWYLYVFLPQTLLALLSFLALHAVSRRLRRGNTDTDVAADATTSPRGEHGDDEEAVVVGMVEREKEEEEEEGGEGEEGACSFLNSSATTEKRC